jgi:hypothetical protein
MRDPDGTEMSTLGTIALDVWENEVGAVAGEHPMIPTPPGRAPSEAGSMARAEALVLRRRFRALRLAVVLVLSLLVILGILIL